MRSKPLKVVWFKFMTSSERFEIVFRRFLLIEKLNSILDFLRTLIRSSTSVVFAFSSSITLMYSKQR